MAKLGERTLDQIKHSIVAGEVFLARLPSGGIVARYEEAGTVFLITRHGIWPLPQQGGDLCWLINSLEEEGASLDPDTRGD